MSASTGGVDAGKVGGGVSAGPYVEQTGEVGGEATEELLSDEELSDIRRREAAATPGPWWWDGSGITAPEEQYIFWPANVPAVEDPDPVQQLGALGLQAEPDAEANLAFLSHARTDIPSLLAEIDRLRALVAAAERQGEERGAAKERERMAREFESRWARIWDNAASVTLNVYEDARAEAWQEAAQIARGSS